LKSDKGRRSWKARRALT